MKGYLTSSRESIGERPKKVKKKEKTFAIVLWRVAKILIAKEIQRKKSLKLFITIVNNNQYDYKFNI